MFQEIIQGIVGIVNILNISDKTTSLESTHKRKMLGFQLRKLYESVSRSVYYSQKIEEELKKIISLDVNKIEDTCNALCEIILPNLGELLTKQKYELIEFESILMTDNGDDCCLPLLIEIYGDDMESEFGQLRSFKYSVIDWVDYYLLKKIDNSSSIILPKTFKLSDIPIFKDTYESAWGFYYTDSVLSNNPEIEKEFMTEIKFSTIKSQESTINIIEQCDKLIKEIIDLNTSKKLIETKSKLANIIRSNFTMEEII